MDTYGYIGLECLAIKKVREEMGLKNVIVMIPFCKTPSVKPMISSVIKTAKKLNRKVGICGQAPSDYPNFTAF